MGKRITAYSAGRINGNTEVYLKEALWAARELGCDVELIRLNECDIRPCRACKKQLCGLKGQDACPLKDDDGWWLVEKFLDSDGFLMGAPVWAIAPPGIVSVFRDRVMGPKMDISGHALWGEPNFIKGRAKARPGALISVGGALTEHWISLGLATQFSVTFSAQIEVVDHMNVTGVADPGAATLYEKYLERARELGRNLAYAVLHPEESNDWRGPDTGMCPGCHTSLMMMKPGSSDLTCAVCGRHGRLTIKNDKVVGVEFVENDPDDRLRIEGKFTHGKEVGHVIETEYLPRKEEAKENMKKYIESIDFIVRPPSKQ